MNVLYPKFKEGLGLGQIGDMTAVGVVIKAMLVDEALYTYNAAHQFLSDVAAGARGPSTAALAGKTFTNGVFDANDSSWTAPAAGTTYEGLLLYIDTGVAGTSRLIQYANDGTWGLPVTTNGQDVAMNWDNGANKIFSL